MDGDNDREEGSGMGKVMMSLMLMVRLGDDVSVQSNNTMSCLVTT